MAFVSRKLICGLIFWITITLILIGGAIIRINVLSLIYLICLLIAPLLPTPTSKSILGHTGRFLKFVMLFSGLACLGHVIFHVTLVAMKPYGHMLQNCTFIERAIRELGYQKINEASPLQITRLIVPDVLVLIVSALVYLLLRKLKPYDDSDKLALINTAQQSSTYPINCHSSGHPATKMGISSGKHPALSDSKKSVYLSANQTRSNLSIPTTTLTTLPRTVNNVDSENTDPGVISPHSQLSPIKEGQALDSNQQSADILNINNTNAATTRLPDRRRSSIMDLVVESGLNLFGDPVDGSHGNVAYSSSSKSMVALRRSAFGPPLVSSLCETGVFILLAACGIIYPSLLSVLYFILFIGSASAWACCKRFLFRTTQFCTKSALDAGTIYDKTADRTFKCLISLRFLLLIYIAAHILILYLYQFEHFQLALPPESLTARLLGLTAIVKSNCNAPWEMNLFPVGWDIYLNPAFLLSLYWVLCMNIKISFSLRYLDLRNLNFGPSHINERNLNETSKLLGDKSLQKDQSRNTTTLHPNPQLFKTNKNMERTLQATLPYSEKIDSSNLGGQTVQAGDLSSDRIKNKNPDYPLFHSTSHVKSDGTNLETKSSLNASSQRALKKPVKHWTTHISPLYYLFVALINVVIRQTYVISLILMMVWAITYHSWLTFIFLLWACIIWMTPNSRKSCLYSSPFFVGYAIILLFLQYIYGLKLTENELPTGYYHDFPLQQFGLIKYKYPSLPLALKTIYTCLFWITMRQFIIEKKEENVTRVISLDGEQQKVIKGALKPSDIISQDGTRITSRLGNIAYWFCVKYWILICCGFLLFMGITGSRVSLYRIGYTLFFVVFLITFQIAFRVWKVMMYTFWLFLIGYSMVVLIFIYTYQFQNFPEYWHKRTHLTYEMLRDIGLEQYDTKTLFVRLFTPVAFIVIIILQVHYFHSPFLELIDLEKASTRQRDTKDELSKLRASERNLELSAIEKDMVYYFYWITRRLSYSWRVLSKYAWRLCEIHCFRIVAIALAFLSIYEPKAINVPFVGIIVIGLAIPPLQLLVSYIAAIWVGCLIVGKMTYQLDYFKVYYFYTNCTGIPPINSTVDNVEWLGFAKVNEIAFYIKGYIGLLLLLCFQKIVKLHERKIRLYLNRLYAAHISLVNSKSTDTTSLKPLPTNVKLLNPKNPSTKHIRTEIFKDHEYHHQIKDPLYNYLKLGVIFPGVNRRQADFSLYLTLKYLANFGFYKFGVEITLISIIATIGLRWDAWSVIYSIWLGVLLFPSRKALSIIWPFYVMFLVVVIPLQYLARIGMPPGLCLDYPWTNTVPPTLRNWLFLPDFFTPPSSYKLSTDFFQLLFATCQLAVFRIEYETGLPNLFGFRSRRNSYVTNAAGITSPTAFVNQQSPIISQAGSGGTLRPPNASFKLKSGSKSLANVFAWKSKKKPNDKSALLPVKPGDDKDANGIPSSISDLDKSKNVVDKRKSYYFGYNANRPHSPLEDPRLEESRKPEYEGGSNREIWKIDDIYTIDNPIPDFVSHTSTLLDKIKFAFYSYSYWVTLTIMLITATNRVSLFCMGYLIASFLFLWYGNELFLKPLRIIMKFWMALIAYNFAVIFIKALLQVIGCVYMKSLEGNLCWLVQLLSIACLKPGFGTSKDLNVSQECSVPVEQAGIMWDGICFVFLLLQKRIFGSYYFKHIISEIRAQQLLASRGAELVNQIKWKEVTEQEAKERGVMEKIKKKMEQIKNQNQKLARRATQEPTDHFQAIRSGDYYMFEDVSDEDTEEALADLEYPEPKPLEGDEEPKSMGPIQLLNVALTKGGIKDAVKEGRESRSQEGTRTTYEESSSGSATPRDTSALTSRKSILKRKGLPGLVSADSIRSQPLPEESSPAFEDVDLPTTSKSIPTRGHDDKDPIRRADGDEEAQKDIVDEVDEMDEEEQIMKRSFIYVILSKIKYFLHFVLLFIYGLLESATQQLNRISLDYRYIAQILSREKAQHKEFEKRRISDITHRSVEIPMDDQTLTTYPPPSYNTERNLANINLYGDDDDELKHIEDDDLIQAYKTYETFTQDESAALKPDKSIITKFITALYYVLISRSELVCYFLVVLNMLQTASILALPMPFMVFLWGTLSIPRPSKTFWVSLITYVEAVVIIKYLFQFGFFPWVGRERVKDPFWPPRILGIEKKEYYAVYDLVLLLILFFHRSILKSLGLWRDNVKSLRKRSNPDKTLDVTEEPTPNNGKTSNDTPSIQVDKTLVSSKNVNGLDQHHQGLRQRRKGNNKQEDSERSGTPETPDKDATNDSEEGTIEIGDMDGKSGKRSKKQLLLMTCDFSHYFKTFWNFFDKLLHPQFRVTADVYAPMFLCDFITFLIVVFGYSSFGSGVPEEGDVTSYISENKIPIPFLIMLVAQFALIIIDRAIFLRKYILGKLVFQFFLVILVHIWMFFILPKFTERELYKNTPAKLWYFAKSCYFLLSSYQVRSGYPTRILGNFLTKKYNYANLFLFKGFTVIPFLWELRTIMDWMWTDTTLTIFYWIKLEDIYANIFVLKCYRVAEVDYPTPRGIKRQPLTKYAMGGIILFILIFIIWFPLVLFALTNTVGTKNLPYDCTLQISVGGYAPLFRMSARNQFIKPFTKNQFTALMSQHIRDKPVQVFLSNYEAGDVIEINLMGNSTDIWTISPPSLRVLQQTLYSNSSIEMRVQWSFTRVASTKLVEPTVTEHHSFTLEPGSGERQKLSNMLIFNYSQPILIKNVFPKYVRVPAKENPTFVKPLVPNGTASFRDVTLKLKNASLEGGKVFWWEVREIPPPNVHEEFFHPNFLTIIAFSDLVFPGAFTFFAQYGIIGLYISLVLVIGRFVRSFVSGLYSRIMFDELPNVDRVLQLCLDIYLVRESGEFKLEEELFAKLIFLYRSPETLIKWTKEKLS